MTEYVFDIEANGLDPDKIHCLVLQSKTKRKCLTSIGDMEWHLRLECKDVLIGHNIVRYDVPVIKRLVNISLRPKLVDTLALSWYLFPHRNKHGLADWGEEFGIPKPVIDDWDNLTQAEYLHRCKEDVKINTKLWELQKEYLEEIYGVDGYWGLIEYLTFKMECARLQEEVKWRLDVEGAWDLLDTLLDKQGVAKTNLETNMPPVPKYRKAKRPAKPFKQDGTLSAHGNKWEAICEEAGKDFDYEGIINVLTGYKPPNANGHQQIKDWLFSLGWKPETYKYVKEKELVDKRGRDLERKIPQIRNDDGLCKSIERMIPELPELRFLEELGVLQHRVGLVKGMLAGVDEDGFTVAQVQGLTNTLRFKHKTLVNIPSLRKPYGKEIRGLLLAPSDDWELCGSDMCSLEDRTKQHFMWDYDPDYVKDMMVEGFDPHLDIGLVSKTMTQKECDDYRSQGLNSDKRHDNKQINYSATYGVGAAGVVRNSGMKLSKATHLLKSFWERNWSIKAIADDCEIKTIEGVMWLYNPVSKLWYNLRAKKDRFSTLNQGTGTYCFDMWVKQVLTKPVKICGQFHDEIIFGAKKGHREIIEKHLKDSVQFVNEELKLNRDLDVDVSFGESYADVH